MPRRRCFRLTFVALGRAASVSWSAPVRAGASKALASPLRRSDGDATRDRAAILGAFICAALTSCAVGPDYLARSRRCPPISPRQRRSVRSSDRHADRPLETTQWWRTLHDRELDSLVERAACRQPDARNRLGPLATGARPGSRRHRRRAARGRVERRRRLGYRQRSRARPRFANPHLRRKRSRRRASRQSRRLRCGLGARYFRQVPARHRGRAIRCRRAQSPPAMSCWFRSLPMSFAPTSICARSRCSLLCLRKDIRGGAQIRRFRPGTLQPRHHQRARRNFGPARTGAIAGAGCAARSRGSTRRVMSSRC